MANSIDLVEAIGNADYASMDYHQLVDLELTLSWAREIINAELSTKRQQRLKALTDRYSARDNSKCTPISVATKNDAAPSPEIESPKEESIIPTEKTKASKTEEKDIVTKVVELAKETPIPSDVVSSAPYYFCCQFKKSEDGQLLPFGSPCGWNMSAGALKKLKAVEKTHVESRYKNVRTTPRGSYLVFRMEGGLYRVSYFKIEGVELEPDFSKAEEFLKDELWAESVIDEALKENEELAQAIRPSSTPSYREIIDQAKKERTKSSVKKEGKGPRGTIIIGVKDGEQRRWSSFRACEKDLGVSPGTASQVVSGKMKSAKGWKLMKEED